MEDEDKRSGGNHAFAKDRNEGPGSSFFAIGQLP
jgi:hypothetical protein